jgi:hypothetical protein
MTKQELEEREQILKTANKLFVISMVLVSLIFLGIVIYKYFI